MALLCATGANPQVDVVRCGLFAIVLAAAGTAPASGQTPSAVPPELRTRFILPDTTRMPADARMIIRLERQRSPAIARNDSATLRRIYASDFRGVTAIGDEVNREQLLAVFARDDGSSRFIVDRMAVRFLPRVAVSTMRLTTLDTAGVVQSRIWLLHVYESRGGRWVIVAAQGTLVREPADHDATLRSRSPDPKTRSFPIRS